MKATGELVNTGYIMYCTCIGDMERWEGGRKVKYRLRINIFTEQYRSNCRYRRDIIRNEINREKVGEEPLIKLIESSLVWAY